MGAVHVHTVSSVNLPAAALKIEYLPLRDEYWLVPVSDGAGQHRVGMDRARQLRVREDNTTFSTRSDAHIILVLGVAGGAGRA